MQPSVGEWGCYKRATLSFEGVEAVQGLPQQEEIRPYIGADGARDYGGLTGLRQEAPRVYRFEQDFSDIRVRCDALRLSVSGG